MNIIKNEIKSEISNTITDDITINEIEEFTETENNYNTKDLYTNQNKEYIKLKEYKNKNYKEKKDLKYKDYNKKYHNKTKKRLEKLKYNIERKHLKNNNKKIEKKIIIFDLDETIGYFQELNLILKIIKIYFKIKITQEKFNAILDLFEFYLRPNILSILKYINTIKEKEEDNNKQKEKKLFVAIYTNNQGGKKWVKKITNYLHYKIGNNLFDTVINSYSINGLLCDNRRTTQYKTKTDIYKIFKTDENNSIILFFDNEKHNEMYAKNIYYLQLSSYIYHYKEEEITKMFLQMEKLIFQNKNITYFDEKNFQELLTNVFQKNYFRYEKYEITNNDRENSREIMYSIIYFLKIKHNKTRKNKNQ